jgi:hypothetical protein
MPRTRFLDGPTERAIYGRLPSRPDDPRISLLGSTAAQTADTEFAEPDYGDLVVEHRVQDAERKRAAGGLPPVPRWSILLLTGGERVMDYQVVISRDREAGVWIVRDTNIPGLTGENPSLDNLLAGLPDTVSWLFSDPKREPVKEVPFKIIVEDHETVRLAAW